MYHSSPRTEVGPEKEAKKSKIFLKKKQKKAHFRETLSQKNYRKKHILTNFRLQITKKKREKDKWWESKNIEFLYNGV